MTKGKVFLFIIGQFFASGLNAQDWLQWFGVRPLDDTISSEKSGFAVIPLLYYTPDTRLAFGAAGVYYFSFKAKKPDQKDARLSYVQFLADYTQNKQLDIWALWNVFTRNEDFLLKGELRYRNFPDRFYGIGNATLVTNEEFYAYDLKSFKYLMLKRLKGELFMGFDLMLSNEYNFKVKENGLLDAGDIIGNRGGVTSGLGLVMTYDDRDNIVNSYKGHLFEISTYFYDKIIGSNFNYINVNLTYQTYFELKPKNVLAVQLVGRYNTSGVPMLDMATVGGEEILRGYARNRFRDRNFTGFQLEYRFPLFWRLGMVTFAGAGDVFKTVSDLSLQRIKYSVGTGLRFVINPAERLNLRFDVGLGREGAHYYLMVTEAF
ncbi:MAG: BamA/TamA family outer membrane protein [Thermaurantimonas sp.]|uniref:BamA/TamA family outer membrane protein n=1 Tax=Thermaurantimonas sp. TaxID=2681568 RepID=UPI00391BA48B